MECYTEWIKGQAVDPKKAVRLAISEANKVSGEILQIDAECLECLRLSMNFLDNAQKYVDAVDAGLIRFEEPTLLVPAENESLAFAKSMAPEPETPPLPKKIIPATVGPETSPWKLSSELQEALGEDLNHPSLPTCGEIRILKEDLKQAQEKIQELENLILVEQRSKKRIEKAKQIMDEELEDLTSTLFDQANQMVISESRLRDDLNVKNKDLSKHITSLTQRLASREEALITLKKAVYLETKSEKLSGNLGLNPQDIRSAIQPIAITQTSLFLGYRHTIISGYDEFRSFVGVDGIIFREFQESIRSMAISSTQTAAQALAMHLNTQFIKRCMIEDVEPCLFYTYQANSSFTSMGVATSQSTKRKLMDFATRNQLEIEMYQPSKDESMETNISDPKSPPPVPPKIKNGKSFACRSKCSLCAIQRDCEYYFRYGPLEKQALSSDWHIICRFCRDRLTSAVDFFKFLEYLRQGHIGPGKCGATILSLFRQVLWLRRRMNAARVGSCSLFETELSSVQGSSGSDDSDKYITIIS